jgi:hypothetical protein
MIKFNFVKSVNFKIAFVANSLTTVDFAICDSFLIHFRSYSIRYSLFSNHFGIFQANHLDPAASLHQPIECIDLYLEIEI